MCSELAEAHGSALPKLRTCIKELWRSSTPDVPAIGIQSAMAINVLNAEDPGLLGLPRSLVACLTILGFYFVAAKLVSFVRVVLSLFILPGISVRHTSMELKLCYSIDQNFTAPRVRP